MAEIKSALELALEKAEQYGRASKEDLRQDTFKEQGRQWAVQYLKEEEVDLEKKLAGLPAEGQASARQAMKEVFLRNIILPKEETIDARQNLAMAGVMASAANKKAMARVKQEVEQLMQQFLMSRTSAYQQLKSRFGQTLGSYTNALEAQTEKQSQPGSGTDPRIPAGMAQIRSNLVTQFEPVLEDRKQQMLQL